MLCSFNCESCNNPHFSNPRLSQQLNWSHFLQSKMEDAPTTALDFCADLGYLAVGNKQGEVLPHMLHSHQLIIRGLWVSADQAIRLLYLRFFEP